MNKKKKHNEVVRPERKSIMKLGKNKKVENKKRTEAPHNPFTFIEDLQQYSKAKLKYIGLPFANVFVRIMTSEYLTEDPIDSPA